MKYLLIAISLFFCQYLYAQADQDAIIDELTATIHQSAGYDRKKIAAIRLLEQTLNATAASAIEKRFDLTKAIYEEFKIFNYDSAYRYSIKLLDLSRQMGDPDHVASAKMKVVFILLSAGLYKETYDSLQTADISNSSAPVKAEYYTLKARYYYDIAAYENDNFHSVDYDIKGSGYLDSALIYYPAGSFEQIYYSGLKYFKQGKTDSAYSFFVSLLDKKNLTEHQYALTASTLSGIYQQRGDIGKAIELLAKATEADIKSSTKETVAIFHLAELLYKTGRLKQAAICIESAIANAEFYGARQRKLQASSILPLIEGERIAGIEAQKHLLTQYAVVVTILVLLLAALIYIVFKQVKKLKQAQQLLTQSHIQQQVINRQLEETNKRLEETNEKLQEANKIKEEYIGYFFNTDSQLYARLDKIKTTLLQKISERKYDEARFFIDKIDPKRDKDELLQNFDKLFLKLFPHFVEEVNLLLHPEESIKLKEDEPLNTDLRIFALIRMGVSDTDKIAQILDYSVKTIYAYKTKMKNKSILPNEDFEKMIMKIKPL